MIANDDNIQLEKNLHGGLDDNEHESKQEMVSLISSDNVVFRVDREGVMKCSNFIQSALEMDKTSTEIHLTSIHSSVLAKVMEFMQHRIDNIDKPLVIQCPLPHRHLQHLFPRIDPWYLQFIELSDEHDLLRFRLVQLINAANFLDFHDLIQLCGAKIGSLMIGKKPDEIKQDWTIPDDKAAAFQERGW